TGKRGDVGSTMEPLDRGSDEIAVYVYAVVNRKPRHRIPLFVRKSDLRETDSIGVDVQLKLIAGKREWPRHELPAAICCFSADESVEALHVPEKRRGFVLHVR